MEKPKFDKSLEERFKDFLSSRKDSQDIDEMNIPKEHQKLKRADYLLNGNIVVELKSLQKDPSYKIEEILEPHREREGFPIHDGPLEKILKQLPDGDAINRKIFFSVTKSVQQCFEKADKQIRDTKVIIDQPSATGVLALLNDEISVLEPKVIAYIIRYMMSKRSDDKSYRYQNIHFVYFLTEAHYQEVDYFGIGTPLITIDGPNAKHHKSALQQFKKYSEEWGRYNNVPLFYSKEPVEKQIKQGYRAFGSLKKPSNKSIKMKEYWRREYRDNPYLRHLSEQNFIAYGREIIKSLEPYYLKGFLVHSEAEKMKLLTKWAHFLEETNCRGLNAEEVKSIIGDAENSNLRKSS